VHDSSYFVLNFIDEELHLASMESRLNKFLAFFSMAVIYEFHLKLFFTSS